MVARVRWPEGYDTVGNAQCLVIDSMPAATRRIADSTCEEEKDALGNRLGAGNVLAVYTISLGTGLLAFVDSLSPAVACHAIGD